MKNTTRHPQHLGKMFLTITFIISVIASCSKPDDDDMVDPPNIQSDCINLCEHGDPIQSENSTVELCECDCNEGFYGELCEQYFEPTGFLIYQASVTNWPSYNGGGTITWDPELNPQFQFPDIFLSISESFGQDFGTTQAIHDIPFGETVDFIGSPFPIFIPTGTTVNFIIKDDDSLQESTFQNMAGGAHTFTAEQVLIGNTLDLSWQGSGQEFQLTLVGEWKFN